MSELLLLCRSKRQTHSLGRWLGKLFVAGDWLGLTGELGAGKTCLAQGIARGLEVGEGVQVTSPTFVIHQMIPGRLLMHHLDLYRVESLDQLAELGYEEFLDSGGVCVVEWCEIVPESIPGRGVIASIELLDEKTRQIRMRALDERGSALLGQIRRRCAAYVREPGK